MSVTTKRRIVVSLGAEFFGDNFDHRRVVAELQRMGIEFKSSTCPVQFAGETQQIPNDDGSVTYIQEIPIS